MVVLRAGVVIVCVCARRSDHARKSYVTPFRVCGDTAPIDRRIPTTLVNVNGAMTGWPSSVSVSPVALAASVTCAVLGVTSLSVDACWPAESVTVRRMRYHTFVAVSPTFGTVKEPRDTPVIGPSSGRVWVPW